MRWFNRRDTKNEARSEAPGTRHGVIDVLIVGAGPAGATAAIVLARAGVRVLVIDRARFPRDKLCGDTINPGTLRILARLNLDSAASDGLPVRGMIVTGESGVGVEGRYGDICGRALKRSAFDAALVAAAIRAGACVDEGVLAREPIVEDGQVRGVWVAGPGGHSIRILAPLTIAADGSHSRLARALGLARSAAPRRWVVGAYFEDVDGLTDCGEMHVRAGRYVGVAPLPRGLTNACIVTANRNALRDPVALLEGALRNDRLLSDRFARARRISAPVCFGPLAVDSASCGVPGLLLAGDAAGFIDPMTGDGLRFAVRGGELAAEAALPSLTHGHADAHVRLLAARRGEFAAKWRFNRALRALVESPAAIRAAGRGATLLPQILRHVIRYAGDLRAA
jgi:geranylgeranyl reductase family protein